VADAGRHNGVPVFMCGEMAGDPLFIPILLGLGLKELSTNAQSIPMVKNAIRTVEIVETHDFVAKVLNLTTTEQIEELVYKTYGNQFNNNNHHHWE
jgi:phosphotransferase system enzyme I (PtsI)